MIEAWRVHILESERGWGQDHYHEDYSTEEKAKARYKEINDRNTAAKAPDFYIVANSIEHIKLDITA